MSITNTKVEAQPGFIFILRSGQRDIKGGQIDNHRTTLANRLGPPEAHCSGRTHTNPG